MGWGESRGKQGGGGAAQLPRTVASLGKSRCSLSGGGLCKDHEPQINPISVTCRTSILPLLIPSWGKYPSVPGLYPPLGGSFLKP